MNNMIDDAYIAEIKLLKQALFKNKNICFALLFGSYASGKYNERSDIDIGLYFYRAPEGLDILYLINHLSGYVQQEVDITILNRASAFLRHQIMLNCKRLFIKDRIIYRDYREKTITDFFNYKYISDLYLYDKEL